MKLCHRQSHWYPGGSSEVEAKRSQENFSRNRSPLYSQRFILELIAVFYSKTPDGLLQVLQYLCNIPQLPEQCPARTLMLNKAYHLTDSLSLDAQTERPAKCFSL